ncbi:MATH domain and coiled-coil domain-containing protein [Trifolium repens]|nr:MATH domain and coiled-coil domain-containing protein [Trifolium repens]
MEQEQSSVEKYEKFTWKIENFSHLKTDKIYSEPFVIGGYPWKISLYPRGHDYLTIYLSAVETANISKGWSRYVKFNLFVFNQLDSNMTIKEDFDDKYYEFNASSKKWGEDIMKLDELNDPNKGFIVEDACIVGAEVYDCKSKNEKQVNQAFSLTTSLPSVNQIVQMDAEILKPKVEERHGQNLGELMDFKGLGQIEKDLVPLLEEVCSHHPSLIECQQNRSRKFKEWAFTALGRVLHFLKTTKVKDMNDLACKDLHNLWEELEAFSFDLTWLEPHVQSALGMRSYLEKVKKVEKLKDNEIENFSCLKTDEVCSEPFVMGGYPWKICLCPRGDEVDDHLAMYLAAVKTANMSEGWSRYVKFNLLVFNQLDSNMTIKVGDCVKVSSDVSNLK